MYGSCLKRRDSPLFLIKRIFRRHGYSQAELVVLNAQLRCLAHLEGIAFARTSGFHSAPCRSGFPILNEVLKIAQILLHSVGQTWRIEDRTDF